MKVIKINIQILLVATFISLAPDKVEAINKNNDSFARDDLTIIIQHQIKAVRKAMSKKDTLWVKKTVYLYSYNQGKMDSVLIDLSALEIDMENLGFIVQMDSSKNTLEIKLIKFFMRKNKFELHADISRGISGGYSASYIYKKRKGLFKRWVFKRFVGTIWCGYF